MKENAGIPRYPLNYHESYDGTGYPQGLKGKEIPKLSRLLAIVDAYDVMTHNRVYRQAMSNEKAIEEIKRCSGKQFDPVMTEIFLHYLDEGLRKEVIELKDLG